MPYFKWIGVNLVGDIKQGKLPAYSPKELSDNLLKKGIALISCKKKTIYLFFGSTDFLIKGRLFARIAQLLRAGILLPEALAISAEQSSHPIVHDNLFLWALDIKNGVPFSITLEKQKILCDSIVITILIAAHEVGNLIDGFQSVAHYYNMRYEFRKGMRTAIAMPLLTLFFFVGISLLIFIFIMPRFADMFSSLHYELPTITHYLLVISEWLRSVSLWLLCAIIIVMILLVKWYKESIIRFLYSIMMRISWVNHLICFHELGQAFVSLSLLLKNGVSLSCALKTISASISNQLIKKQFIFLYDEVQQGQLLSDAMSVLVCFSPEVVAVIKVGEESGTLGCALEHAAEVYKDILQHKLMRFIFFLQPTMVVILGLLIAALIFAVYLPIMNLAYAI